MQGDIFIYGVIGSEVDEISFENIKAQIAKNKEAKELTVHIISPGGDVWEGYSIYNALKNTGKKITAHIEGTCASIATLIAGAADKIIMNRTAQFMIHNPHITGLSQAAESKDLRNVADQLDQIKTLLIQVYEGKTGMTKDKLWELYDNETWMTADNAKELGFIDESVDAIKAVAKIDVSKFKNEMKNQKEVEGLMARITNLFKGSKLKNEAVETLADGTVIVVLTDDGDWTGKQVMYESGEPLPSGDHTLASGKVIIVEDGVITEVKDKEVIEDQEVENLSQELEAANKKVAESEARATAAEAKAVKFENKIKALEKEFIALKEETLKTFGDQSKPNVKGASFKNKSENDNYDPMGDDMLKYIKSRNIG